jgi:uncharacterized protein
MAKFIIYRRKNGGYEFRLKADNGTVLLSSEGYSAKAGCLNGIESVRKNGVDRHQYDKKTTAVGMYYFNLKNGNGAVIGSSGMYESAAGRDNGVLTVQSTVVDATIVDETAQELVNWAKEKRKQLGLTQQQLAEKAGVGLRFLRELEQGKQTLRIDKVNQVLQLFGYELGPVLINRNNWHDAES